MIVIRAPHLEIAVLVLGITILLLETFAAKTPRKYFAYAGIFFLTALFFASFSISPESSAQDAGGFWNFYTADALAIFFKRFMLVTTIIVLAMMVDYAPALCKADESTSANLGEFFSLPLLTCAGLMYLVSAVDFIFIFVSLELVTISFFVLVSFPRRNPIALEAGVKYLILGALSTAFLVYGITWIFGVTGETNLARITASFSSGKIDNHAATFYLVAYLLMTLLGFAILIIVAQQTGEEISGFDGLAKRAPFLAFAMLVAMASLAGLPFTAGFFGKFFIFVSAVAQKQTALVAVGVVTVACGFYYYLRVVRAMYWQPSTNSDAIPVSVLSLAIMILLIITTIWLGVYPQPILDALQR